MTQFRAKSPLQIAQYLSAHRKAVRVSFWLGAGASASSQIPTASEFVRVGLERFPYLAPIPDNGVDSPYASLMRRFTPFTRRTLVNELLENARQINWTHLLIAQLIEAGWVNLVLTTNFDDQMSRALNLLQVRNGRLLDLQRFGPVSADAISDGTTVYLSGYGDSNRPVPSDELAPFAPTIRQLLYRAAQDSVVIVLGYSGFRDPMFELLKEMPETGHGFFWVTRDREPAPHVASGFFQIGRYSEFFGQQDADRFMAEMVLRGMNFPDPAPLSNPTRFWDGIQGLIGPRPIAPIRGDDDGGDDGGGNDGGDGGSGGEGEPAAPDSEYVPADLVEVSEPDEAEALSGANVVDVVEDEPIDVEAVEDDYAPAEPGEADEDNIFAPGVVTADASAELEPEPVEAEPVEATPYEPAVEAGALAPEEYYDPVNGLSNDELVAGAHEALVMGDTETMIETAMKALDMGVEESFDEITGTLLDFGQDLYEQDRVDEAKRVLEMAVQLRPDRPEPYWRLHSVARRLGDAEAADRMADMARERERNGN